MEVQIDSIHVATFIGSEHVKQDSKESRDDVHRSLRRYFELKPFISPALSADDQSLMLIDSENEVLCELLPTAEQADVVTVALQYEGLDPSDCTDSC